MTVGFERSLLERKERDELSQIAESLGEKPPARAKKADIVDLILRLAGVPLTPDAGASPEASAAEAAPEAPAATPRAPRARKAAPANGSSTPAEPTAAEDTTEPADEESVPAPAAAASEPSGTRPGQGRPMAADAGPSEGGPATNGGNHGGDLGDDEPGNRRRRRRGRDRDRPAGGAGGQGNPGTAPAQAGEEVFMGEPVEVEGLLDLRDEGYGFLRLVGYLPSKDDVYVSVKQVRQFSLRKGDALKGAARPATRNEKNPALLRIDSVNGQDPEVSKDRPRFEDLTPQFPTERLTLEIKGDDGDVTGRLIDLLAPIGKGQRGLIVAPPKSGKTAVLKQIVRGLEANHPEVHTIVLLVDERPEEVTDMRRWVHQGEVAASTFDRPADEHVQIAELVLERAKRLVEEGSDVVIILDGISRLARAHGAADGASLYPAKRFFGAARNLEEQGSLTIVATALVETNSGVDDHIYEEFQGTANMELKLDRQLAEQRVFPAIDVAASSTRHVDELFSSDQQAAIWKLRQVLQGASGEGASPSAALELLMERMASAPSNEALLADLAKA